MSLISRPRCRCNMAITVKKKAVNLKPEMVKMFGGPMDGFRIMLAPDTDGMSFPRVDCPAAEYWRDPDDRLKLLYEEPKED